MTKHERKYGIARKLLKTGVYTYYITIPKDYIEELGWKVGEKVNLKLSGEKIVLSAQKP